MEDTVISYMRVLFNCLPLLHHCCHCHPFHPAFIPVSMTPYGCLVLSLEPAQPHAAAISSNHIEGKAKDPVPVFVLFLIIIIIIVIVTVAKGKTEASGRQDQAKRLPEVPNGRWGETPLQRFSLFRPACVPTKCVYVHELRAASCPPPSHYYLHSSNSTTLSLFPFFCLASLNSHPISHRDFWTHGLAHHCQNHPQTLGAMHTIQLTTLLDPWIESNGVEPFLPASGTGKPAR